MPKSTIAVGRHRVADESKWASHPMADGSESITLYQALLLSIEDAARVTAIA